MGVQLLKSDQQMLLSPMLTRCQDLAKVLEMW